MFIMHGEYVKTVAGSFVPRLSVVARFLEGDIHLLYGFV